MHSHLGLSAVLLHFLSFSNAAIIYVSTTGSDSGSGTIAAPLKSIQSAVDVATAGSTIYLRAGTYSLTTNIQIKKSGTSTAPYILSAYGSEKVIIDGEGLPYTPAALDASLPSASRGILHIEKASFWNFYNLELINGPYGVYAVDSSNNRYERLITRDNYETGFQIQGTSSNNLVLYLDSYGNRDPRKNGESADGFGCKEGSGTGNIIRGARLWNNVDDGLDLWYGLLPPNPGSFAEQSREFKSAVTIEDTIAWGNGVNRWGFTDFAGDGNGFKLGGGNAGDIGPANHVIKNSIAFQNAAKGFTDNSQTGSFTLTRNTAWDNGDVGFKMSTASSTLTSNIAAVNGNAQTTLTGSQTQTGNSWNIGGTWNNAAFLSVNPATMTGPRASTGKITSSDFLIPASGAAIGATTE